ncbi:MULTISPECIES: hypothetical protein [unclassified Synechococcus]
MANNTSHTADTSRCMQSKKMPHGASKARLFFSDAVRLAERFNHDQERVERSEAELVEG